MRKTNDGVILQMLDEGKSQKEIANFFNVSPAAICKRLKRIKPLPESLEKLTDKEREFALQVAEGSNQTQAALASHDCSSLASAKSMGSQLMAKPDIQTAVAEIMQDEGLTRRYRVTKLKNHIDNTDPGISLKGLDQSWKLEGAYVQKHIVIQPTIADMHMDLEEIERRIAELEGRSGDEVIDAEIEEDRD